MSLGASTGFPNYLHTLFMVGGSADAPPNPPPVDPQSLGAESGEVVGRDTELLQGLHEDVFGERNEGGHSAG